MAFFRHNRRKIDIFFVENSFGKQAFFHALSLAPLTAPFIILHMKKIFPLFLLGPALLLASCNQQQEEKVKLLYGMMHGEVSSWNDVIANRDIDEETDWVNLDYLVQVDYAGLSGLVEKEESFLVISKGNENTCGCWQGFHASIAKYAKAHRLRVYVIEVKDLAKGDDYYGLKCANGLDDLGIFENGKLRYHHDDKDDWGHKFVELSDWLSAHVEMPKMFYVDEDQLEDLYLGDTPFFVMYTRASCPDCSYIVSTSMKDYLLSDVKIEAYSFIFDVTPWRSIIDDQGVEHQMNDKTIKEGEITWGQYVTASYNRKKEDFGLADEEAGFGSGVVPTYYRISPDGQGTKTGSVIQMAGAFYNDGFENDTITNTYFTAERLEYGCLDYLKNSSVKDKVLTGAKLKEGTSEAQKARDSKAVHDAIRVYHEPIFKALMDAAVKL